MTALLIEAPTDPQLEYIANPLPRVGVPDADADRERDNLEAFRYKARGGPDAAWNLVPLCNNHHQQVSTEQGLTLERLAGALTDAEYAGLVTFAGEGVMERLFGMRA